MNRTVRTTENKSGCPLGGVSKPSGRTGQPPLRGCPTVQRDADYWDASMSTAIRGCVVVGVGGQISMTLLIRTGLFGKFPRGQN